MRILHTSDWHIGRSFHGHPTMANLRVVLDALIEVVRQGAVEVVVVSGDVFDSATPSADAYGVLQDALRGLRDAGAQVVMTSGNHDSATRLGFQSEWLGIAGIHIITQAARHRVPVTIADADGPVHFYGIPYLEPSLIRHLYPGVELRSHGQALGHAMAGVRADIAERAAAAGGARQRSVVLSHCFAADAAAQASDAERDITAGGLNLVAASTFEGPDYVALGHIHGRATLTERVRYSGAPLHYSFSEAHKPRGAWLVELDAQGLKTVDWVSLPIPRPLAVLTGDLDDLLADPAHDRLTDSWVAAVVTDPVRPLDGMRRLQERFTWCVKLEHRPSIVADAGEGSYAERMHRRTDEEIVTGFLELVRNGVGPSAPERALINDIITENAAREAQK